MNNRTYTELTEILAKKERLRRIQEIEETSKSSGHTSWYVLTWNFLAGITEQIQETFRAISKQQPIFDILFPENPGTKSLLPKIAYSSWSFALKIVSPVALGFSWVNTLSSFKQLWEKPERSFWDYANAALSLATSVTWTVLFALGAAGAVAAIAKVIIAVPYLIPAVFGGYALYAITKCMRNCYSAFQSWRSAKADECKAYLRNAGKDLLNIVVNTIALATSIFLGVKMQDATDKLLNAKTIPSAQEAMKSLNDCFDKATSLLYALGTAMAVSVVANTAKMNKETLEVIRHPVDSVKKAWYAMKANPLSAIKTIVASLVTVPLRIASLVITGPIHGLVKLGSKAVNWWRNRSQQNTAKKIDTRPVTESQEKSAETPIPSSRRLQAKVIDNKLIQPSYTYNRIKAKIKTMDSSFPSIQHAPDEIKAKRFHLEELSKFVNGQSKYRSVEEIERASLLISRHGLYRSIKGSEVKEITEEVRTLAMCTNP